MSGDPWEKRLKWIAAIGLTVVWLVTVLMAWNGGSASTLLSENATDMERLIQTIEREAPRIEAATEALKRCKMAQTPEDCG
ncbi:hypothetical protein LCGC14_1553580 [marine sediment metagenome]|uniref:Uncharacterized protein n=1 Tax=marine sediment metagenome TaxID=412755 RepID=A0A0F9IPM0_9ZZZZ